MSAVGKLQEKLAELLQINESMVTHIESLASERDYFKNGMAELQDIIDKLQPERDALVAENEPPYFRGNKEVATRYQFREIGETDWRDCDKGWFEYCTNSPLHDTRIIHDRDAAKVREGGEQ